jgi:diacylglycerol kinase family enzyme
MAMLSLDPNTSPSTKIDTQSNRISNDTADIVYGDGQLSWSAGSDVIKDEDTVTVTKSEKGAIAYTIWSILPVNLSGSDPQQLPLKLRATSATTLPQAFLDKHLLRALPSHLDPAQNHVYVLISTLSGTGLAPGFFNSVVHPLLDSIGLKDAHYNVIRTSSPESVSDFARSILLVQAEQGKKQTVLILSGDGGIVDSINVLLEGGDRSRYIFLIPTYYRGLTCFSYSTYIRPAFSQFPLGTGNALFHSLHKTSPPLSIYMQSLRTLLHGTPRPLPTFYAKFSPGARYLSDEGQKATPLVNGTLYGAVVASYGLHSTLVADSDTTEYRKHGDKRFGLVASNLLSPPEGASPHAYKAEVTLITEGGEVKIDRSEHGYILASMVSNLEKAFTISPVSKPLDGQLRVVHFAAISGEQTMNVMKEAYNNGNHTSLDEVGYESVDGIKIQFREEGESWKWRRCCIDGLIVGVEKGGWMEVQTVESGHEAIDVVYDL